jgi:RNA recognition motif-containing protein
VAASVLSPSAIVAAALPSSPSSSRSPSEVRRRRSFSYSRRAEPEYFEAPSFRGSAALAGPNAAWEDWGGALVAAPPPGMIMHAGPVFGPSPGAFVPMVYPPVDFGAPLGPHHSQPPPPPPPPPQQQQQQQQPQQPPQPPQLATGPAAPLQGLLASAPGAASGGAGPGLGVGGVFPPLAGGASAALRGGGAPGLGGASAALESADEVDEDALDGGGGAAEFEGYDDEELGGGGDDEGMGEELLPPQPQPMPSWSSSGSSLPRRSAPPFIPSHLRGGVYAAPYMGANGPASAAPLGGPAMHAGGMEYYQHEKPMHSHAHCKVYVGNIPRKMRVWQVQSALQRLTPNLPILHTGLKVGFCFLTYETPQDVSCRRRPRAPPRAPRLTFPLPLPLPLPPPPRPSKPASSWWASKSTAACSTCSWPRSARARRARPPRATRRPTAATARSLCRASRTTWMSTYCANSSRALARSCGLSSFEVRRAPPRALALSPPRLGNSRARAPPPPPPPPPADYQTGKSRGYGFVEYKEPAASAEALKAMHEKVFEGHVIRVEFSKRAVSPFIVGGGSGGGGSGSAAPNT